MDEYVVEGPAPRVLQANLTDAVVFNARHHADDVAVARRGVDGWRGLTCAEWCDMVLAAAQGLHSHGVRHGDRVLLLSGTRLEWTLVDYAVWWLGAVTVPVYTSVSAGRLAHILTDCSPALAVVEDSSHRALIESVSDDIPHVPPIVQIEDGGLDDLVARGRMRGPDLEGRRRSIGRDALATIIYTSGTTGHPKGCMLTHGALLHAVTAATHALDDLFGVPGASTLLFLPLPHVFARIVQIGAVQTRTCLGHTSTVGTLTDDLRSFRPTFVLAVPRVFERVFNQASQEAIAQGRSRTFNRAVATAISFSRAIDGRGPTLRQRTRLRRYDDVYDGIRAAFGSNVRYAVSGGAPLGEPLAHFLRGAGVPVLEGYGLTETSAAVTMNRPGAQRLGTVGRPLPGTDVRLADDGELLFRGDQMFSGYWCDDGATHAALRSGWLHSGDLGEIDTDGYVRITGRRHEIIVTAGGKNVSPAVIEEHIRRHSLVDQCLVVGDGRPYVTAFVTLDKDQAKAWAKRHQLPTQLPQLVRHPDLLAEIQRGIDEANLYVSQAEGVRRFRVLPDEWSERTGDVTPTQKLRRYRVLAKVHDEIEALYL